MSGLKSGQVLSSNNQSRLQKGYNFTTGKIEQIDDEESKAARLKQQRQSVVFNNGSNDFAKTQTLKNIEDSMIKDPNRNLLLPAAKNNNVLGRNKIVEKTLKQDVSNNKINLAGNSFMTPSEKQKLREENKEFKNNFTTGQMVSADSVESKSDTYIKKVAKKTGYSEEQVTKFLTDYNQGRWDATDPKYYEANKKFESAGYPVYKAANEVNKYSSVLGEKKEGGFGRAVATTTDAGLNIIEGGLNIIEGLTDSGEYLIARQIENWNKLFKSSKLEEASQQVKDYASMDATKAIFGKNEKDEENFKKDWTKSIENASLLDDRGRSISQGIGNTLAFAALGHLGAAIGLPATATTNSLVFTSSYGNTKSNLLAQGYDEDTATKAAIINGLSETISENIFDFKFGLSTEGWGNNIINGLTNSMDGTAGYLFTKLLESSSEGGEEVVSNVLNAVFNDIAHFVDYNYEYGVDTGNIPQDIWNQLTSEETWEEFMSATISTALVNSASTIITEQQKKEVIKEYAEKHNMSFNEAKEFLQLNENKIANKLTEKNALNSAKQLIDLGYSHKQAMEKVNDMLDKKGLPSIQVIKTNQDVSATDKVINFYGTEMSENDINKKINEIQNLLVKGNITDVNSLERLADALISLQYALNEVQTMIKEQSVTEEVKEQTPKETQPTTTKEETKPTEQIKVQETQKQDISKDTEQEKEHLRNTIRETETNLEKLKSNREENLQKIKQLQQELNGLEKQKTEKTIDKDLERKISKQRMAIEQLQEDIKREKSTYGAGADTLRLDIELGNAKGRLQTLMEQKESAKSENIDAKIEKLQKEIDELKAKDLTKDIRKTKGELKKQKEKLEELDKPLSKDEIGEDIEKENLELEIEQPEMVEVLEKMPTEEKKLADKFKITVENSGMNIDKITTNFISSYHPFEKLARKTGNETILHTLDKMATAESEAQSDISIKGAQRDINGNRVGKSLEQIYKPIIKSGLQTEFDHYLYYSRQATQAQDRVLTVGSKEDMARIKELNETIDEKLKNIDNLTTKEFNELQKEIKSLRDEINEIKQREIDLTKEFVKDMEEEHPEFKEWKQEVLQYEKNLRNMMVDSGLLSKKSSEYLEELYPEYVRIYRDVYKNGSPLVRDGNKIKVNTPVKTVKGGTQDIIPSREALAKQTLEVRKAVRANQFGQSLYDVLGGKDSKYNKSDIENNIIDLGKNKYGYVFYKNGKQTTVDISEEMKKSLDAAPLLKESFLTKGTSKLSKAQRALITNLNPIFALTNMPKDFFDAIINTKNAPGFLANYPKAWFLMVTNNELYQQYKAMGGFDTTVFDYNKGFIDESTAKKILKSPLKMMEFIAEHGEQVTRFAEFLNTLSHGGTMLEAMYNAAEVTVNFKKGGKYTKQLGRYGFNYVNAAVLGSYKAYENIANKKGGKTFLKYAVRLAALSILPSIANSLMYGDDDDYEALPDDVKDKNYLFKIPGTHEFFKLPKGRLNSIISNVPQHLVEGRDITPKSYLGFALDQIGPSNPIESNIYYPLLNVLKNGNNAKNYFGSDIVPLRYKGKSLAEQRKDPKVTSFAKKMSEITCKSPFLVDYLADSYTGFLGDVTMPLMTEQADKNALEAKFIVDSVTSNKYVSEMYDLEDKYAYPKTDDDTIKYKYVYSRALGASDYYSKMRKIQGDKKLSNKEKREEVKKIQTKLNNYAKKTIDTVKNNDVKNKTVDGDKYKQLGLTLYRYDKEEKKWEKVRVNSNEYKDLTD